MIKPKPLQQGDSVAIIAPASPTDKNLIDKCVNSLNALGLKVVVGDSCLSEHGFLSGTDDIRANDINCMFADKNIKGIFALRGGYGCARLLNLIDFKLIKKNPKIFVGYSDITALHIAINQKSKLITYHGPMISTELIKGLDEYSANYYKKFIFGNDKVEEVFNPEGDNLQSINNGISSGQLIGGNLSLICSSLGTKYEINTKNKILFFNNSKKTTILQNFPFILLTKISLFDNILNINGRLAQLVRASGLHPECREFDPLTAHKTSGFYLKSFFLSRIQREN